MNSKWSQLAVLAVVELLAMALWFSTSSVVPRLAEDWRLSTGQQAWITMSVQLGFVIGALASAVLNLADRWRAHRLLAASALAGAALSGCVPLLVSDAAGRTTGGFAALVLLRVATGVCLAGVYPPGMKVMATWFKEGRGLAIGVLVAALTVGSASPHLINALPLAEWAGESALGLSAWRLMMLVASASAAVAGLVALALVRSGPLLPAAARFDWGYWLRIWRDVPVRRANFGYLGHMWELYAMWAWVPLFLRRSITAGGGSETAGYVAAFATIAVGGLGCVAAGMIADRAGRTRTTMAAMLTSSGCALVAGFLYDRPVWLAAVCMVWGLSVVADSAQFSTAVSELCDPRYVGTALTIQTCAGFLLTMGTIRIVPALEPHVGPGWTLAVLALGPLLGTWQMARLRAMPEAVKMASGNR